MRTARWFGHALTGAGGTDSPGGGVGALKLAPSRAFGRCLSLRSVHPTRSAGT